MFKIVKGLVSTDVLSHFKFATFSSRGHSCKLLTVSSRTDVRSNSFFVRVVPVWNSLPEEVVACHTVITFKRRLSTVASNVLLPFCKCFRNL